MDRHVIGGESLQNRFERLYYDPSKISSLGGKKNLLGEIEKSKHEKTEKWLEGEDAYTLHKKVIRKFKRRPTLVSGIYDQLQADLMDVRVLKEHNDGVGFLLTTIDVFSKKAWVFPISFKSGIEVAGALNSLFEENSFRTMQTDKGKEFYNRRVQEVLRAHNVDHFSSENENIKASIVERFNKTLRGRMYRFLTYTNKMRYIDTLDDLVSSYNKTIHSSTGLRPNDVNFDNQEDVWNTLYEQKQWKSTKPKLNNGDHVRIAKAAMSFERGYTQRWTVEIFRVTDVLDYNRPPVYRLTDLNGDSVDGTFYEKELQKVVLPKSFKIEKIIKKRKRGRREELFVKWLGYPDSFNTWVDKQNFV